MPIVTQVEVRYCEDCRFFRENGDREPRCAHPMAHGGNLIKRSNAEAYCSVTRLHSCGQEAKLFEAKPIIEIREAPTPRLGFWSRLFA